MHDEKPLSSEALKEIAQIMTDNDKYSFMTQRHLDAIVQFYRFRHCSKRPDRHSHHMPKLPSSSPFPYNSCPFDPFKEQDQVGLMHQISCAIACEECPPENMKADEHAFWLMRLLGGKHEDEEENLVDEAMCFVALPKLDSKDIVELQKKKKYDVDTKDHYNKILHIRHILEAIIRNVKNMLRNDLLDVKQPLVDLYLLDSVNLAHEIIEVVQVAEIRRLGLGSRFIGRSHLLWAFYALGYGIPPKFRDQIEVHNDEDHPPYHIYLAALKLTKYLGEESTELEYFLLAVIYSNDIGYGGEDVTNFVEIFKDLRQETGLWKERQDRIAEGLEKSLKLKRRMGSCLHWED